jgi:predicted permease
MNWLKQLWQRRKVYDDLQQEIAQHMEETIDELVAGGLSLKEATDAARRKFGNVELMKETAREAWGWRWLEDLMGDVRFGLRMLRKNPGFAFVAVLTLALGIGANTAVFTVVNSVLLRPLHYPQAQELVALHQVAPGAEGLTNFENGLLLSPSMYFTYSDHNRTFQSLGVWTTGIANVTGIAEPEQVRTVEMSDGVLQTFAVPPAAGRWLLQGDQEPGGPKRVMLSYGYWQRRFGGSPRAIGKNIVLDSQPREIVGVMPEGFQFVDADFDVIEPTAFDRGKMILAGFGFHGVGRLKAEVTIAEANADLTRMVPLWMDSWTNGPGLNPHIYDQWRITPMIRPLKQEVIGNVGELLWVVMGTIGVVMLIACANVTNLSLVRVEARQQELAVRTALGAGTLRIVRGLLVESVMLGLLGGVAGVGLAYAGVRFLVATGPSNLPRLNEIAIDAPTLGFTLLVSVLSGLLFGLIPAVKYARPRASSALQGAGRAISASRERHRARNLLVMGQVAMALVLLVCAGLMIRTFEALRTVDPGFADAQHVQLLRISIPGSVVPEPEQVTRMQNAILEKLAAIQGVKSVGFISEMPMEGYESGWDQIYVEGKTYAHNVIPPMRFYKYISPGLLQAAGTKLVAGRDMTWSETYGFQPKAMISENLARELWGTPSTAIGKHLRQVPMMPWHEVIGVIQDTREKGVQETAPEIVYWPVLMEDPFVKGTSQVARTVTFAIRSDRAGTKTFLNELRDAVWAVNSNLPLASVRTMQDVYDKSVARVSFTLVLLGIAAAMALALGTIGLYGVMSYIVSQRQREIGIRLALGAQRGHVLQMVLQQGTKLALAGVAIGIAAGLVLTQLMTHLLFGVTAHDPLTFVVVASILILVALIACYVPARRATLVDPVVAIRHE